MRIGHGYDAHRFILDRPLVLGGVAIAHTHGLDGHSDADVLTHAFMDSILGALALGDIGTHFPDSSNEFKNIYSITLLEKVIELLENKNMKISNADITIIAQQPKLKEHILSMRQKLSSVCKIELDQINVKATTEEQMGFTGRLEGISCHSVVLLCKK